MKKSWKTSIVISKSSPFILYFSQLSNISLKQLFDKNESTLCIFKQTDDILQFEYLDVLDVSNVNTQINYPIIR